MYVTDVVKLYARFVVADVFVTIILSSGVQPVCVRHYVRCANLSTLTICLLHVPPHRTPPASVAPGGGERYDGADLSPVFLPSPFIRILD